MLKALIDGTETLAKKGLVGLCPLCGGKLKPRCGEQKIHHWYHPPHYGCDDWESGKESEWHRRWKIDIGLQFAEKIIERNGEKHRADILIPKPTEDCDLIIEFQNSPISEGEIRKRERFYGNGLIWVVNDKLLSERVDLSTDDSIEFKLWDYEPLYEHYFSFGLNHEEGNPYRISIPKKNYHKDFEKFIFSQGFTLLTDQGFSRKYRKSNGGKTLGQMREYADKFNIQKEVYFNKLIKTRKTLTTSYRWKHARKAYNVATRSVILDINSDTMLLLEQGNVESSSKGRILTKSQFLERIRKHIENAG